MDNVALLSKTSYFDVTYGGKEYTVVVEEDQNIGDYIVDVLCDGGPLDDEKEMERVVGYFWSQTV